MATFTKKYPKFKKPSAWEPNFSIDKVRLRRNLSRESYWDFIQIFWHEIIAEEPVYNWHMRIMAEQLQKQFERIFRNQPKEYDLVFNVPPGSSKSTICSIMPCPWAWSRMPSFRFLNVSFDGDLALEFGTKSRRLIKSQLYLETFPDIQISGDQDTKGHYANTRKGERRATSIGASITGRHSHCIMGDDPLRPTGARSESEITDANEYFSETLPSRCVSLALTPIDIVMQRIGLNDPTAERLARPGGTPVRHYCFPAEESDAVKPEVFRQKYKQGLLDPVRFPLNVLQDKKFELGNFGYSAQFEQQPAPLTGGMFQIDKVKIIDCPPDGTFRQVVRWWDKAASEEKWGAYTSGVLMGVLKDPESVPRYIVLDVMRGKWDTATRERIIKQTSGLDQDRWGQKYTVGLEQEPGSGGKDSVLTTVWNLAGHKVVYEKATGKKVLRADPFSTQWNVGNVALVRGNWNHPFLQEYRFFAEDAKFKDQVDSGSGAFKFLAFKKRRAGGVDGL